MFHLEEPVLCIENKNTNISDTNNNSNNINSLLPFEDIPDNEKLEILKKYCELKWKIFPLYGIDDGGFCTCGRPECNESNDRKKRGKHPFFSWTKKATSNFDIVKKWYSRFPGCNWGAATGKRSGFFVVDIDAAGAIGERDISQETVKSTTGRGQHIYYRYDERLFKSRNGFAENLDFKSDGGYVIIPPSRSWKGGNYSWISAPWETELAVCPKWLIDERLNDTPKRAKRKSKKTLLPKREPDKNESRVIDRQYNSDVRTIPKGQRNDKLFKLARNRHSEGLPPELVFDLMMYLNKILCEKPLQSSEVHALVDSAKNFASHNESIIQLCEENFLRYNENNKIVGLKHEKLAKFVLENNKIFKLRESNSLMFYNPRKGIFEEKDEKSSNLRLDSLAIGLLGDKYEKLWKASSRNDYRALIRPKIDEISIEEFDLHDDKIVVKNGVINLRTSELLDFDHKYRFTKRIDVEYDPKVYSEDWESFLDQICCLDDQKASDEELEDRKELRKYIALVDGYRFTGERNDESIYLPLGSGSNGKSVHHNTISEILGAYAITVPESVITTNNYGDSKAYALAQMQGCRSVNANEVSAGKKLDIEMMKKVTGDDKTNARHPYGRPFQMRNTFKMFIVGNSELFLGIQDRAVRRRLKVIPYSLNLSDNEIDPQIKKKLLKNKPAILKYLVDNAREYYRTNGKIKVPKLVNEASEKYLEETDPLKGYVRDCINFGQKGSSVKMSVLYKNYKIFAEVGGFKPHSAIWFGRHFKAAMDAKNVDSDKQKGGRRTFFDITWNEVQPQEVERVEVGW